MLRQVILKWNSRFKSGIMNDAAIRALESEGYKVVCSKPHVPPRPQLP